MSIGFGELAVIIVVGLLVLGPERLLQVSRSLRQLTRNLRQLMTNTQRELEQYLDSNEETNPRNEQSGEQSTSKQ